MKTAIKLTDEQRDELINGISLSEADGVLDDQKALLRDAYSQAQDEYTGYTNEQLIEYVEESGYDLQYYMDYVDTRHEV